MNTNKTNARIIGALFLVATVTYMIGNGIIMPILDTPDYLHNVNANRTALIIGVLIKFLAATANISIGIFFFPILKPYSEKIALGYFATRIFDCLGVAISAITTLFLITLSHLSLQTGIQNSLMLGNLLIQGSNSIFFVTMIALGIGSIPFCYLLFKTELIPRSLSALGIIGYASLFIGSSLELFGINLYMVHYAPGGLFELFLPLWLFWKGFNSSAINAA